RGGARGRGGGGGGGGGGGRGGVSRAALAGGGGGGGPRKPLIKRGFASRAAPHPALASLGPPSPRCRGARECIECAASLCVRHKQTCASFVRALPAHTPWRPAASNQAATARRGLPPASRPAVGKSPCGPPRAAPF